MQNAIYEIRIKLSLSST